jgi:tRNA nucleotidyltransferase/poly(A) polymerase
MKQQEIFKTILEVSKKTSTDVYVVGGFVRDRLLYGSDYVGKDIDFVVLGSGLEFAKAYDEYLEEAGSLVEFEDFDTARYVFVKEDEEGNTISKKEVEFAGARSEEYDPASRKPSVEPATLEQDLSRRDFTVNAMALPISLFVEGTASDKEILEAIVDPYDGKDDLQKKILKTPLEPNETFSEDPLRMMRAARFASQLNFEIEEKTYKAIDDNAERLKIISAERTQEELFKTLATKVPSVGLWTMHKTGLFAQFFPEVDALGGVEEVKGYAHKDNLSHTFAVVDNIAEYTDKVLLRFAALMHDIAKPDTKSFDKTRGWTFDMHEHLGKKLTRDIGKRLRMKKSDVEYVAKLVRWHLQPIALADKGVTDSPVRRLIVNLEDDLDDLLLLCRSDITTGNQKKKIKRLKNYDILEKRIEEVIEKDNLRNFHSPVRGEEIMELCGLKPGPTVGKIKEAIEEAILDGIIPNEYDAAREYFDKIKDEHLKGVTDWEKAE